MTETVVGVVRCRNCKHPIAEQTARGLRIYNVRWAHIGGPIITLKCDHPHPFNRGRCNTETVIITEAKHQEASCGD